MRTNVIEAPLASIDIFLHSKSHRCITFTWPVDAKKKPVQGIRCQEPATPNLLIIYP